MQLAVLRVNRHCECAEDSEQLEVQGDGRNNKLRDRR